MECCDVFSSMALLVILTAIHWMYMVGLVVRYPHPGGELNMIRAAKSLILLLKRRTPNCNGRLSRHHSTRCLAKKCVLFSQRAIWQCILSAPHALVVPCRNISLWRAVRRVTEPFHCLTRMKFLALYTVMMRWLLDRLLKLPLSVTMTMMSRFCEPY